MKQVITVLGEVIVIASFGSMIVQLFVWAARYFAML